MAIITTILGEKIEIGEDLDTFFDRMCNLSYPCIEFTEIHYPDGIARPQERPILINISQIVSIV